jgi:GNAT superfamily N-acetyltransferase
VRKLARVLSRAFYDDPPIIWVLPDERSRERRARGMFKTILRCHALKYGGVEVTTADGTIAGGAIWLPPGHWQSTGREQVRALPGYVRALGRRVGPASDIASYLIKHHPREEHWYLYGIGVDPGHQGNGVASVLLRSRLARCDEAMLLRVPRFCAVVSLAACSMIAACTSAVATPVPMLVRQFTGKQLAALLVPASALPRGYQPATNTQENSGDRLETSSARYNLTTMSCATIRSDNGRAGFGESAFADGAYLNITGPKGTGVLQQVYQFRAAAAATGFWRGLRAILIRCPDFGDSAGPNPQKVVQRVYAVRYGGDLAFEANITTTGPVVGTVTGELLVVVSGDEVLTVTTIGLGHSVPADPSPRTLMGMLTARLEAGE